VAAVIGISMAYAVDVNEFSMHHFYRNRLTRTYLALPICEIPIA